MGPYCASRCCALYSRLDTLPAPQWIANIVICDVELRSQRRAPPLMLNNPGPKKCDIRKEILIRRI